MRVSGYWVERKRPVRSFRPGGEEYLSRTRFAGEFTISALINSMKTSWLSVSLSALAVAAAQGQISQPAATVGAGQGIIQAQNAPWAATQRDGNSCVWQRTTYDIMPNGTRISNVHNYIELATGMHYLSNGQWLASKEEIDILPNGTAAATNGQHQAYFPGDIYQGVIQLVTPDGKHLQSRPLALSYDDGSNTVLIAELTNSIGYLVSSNQAIYPDAFTGLKGSLRYSYTKSGFEQDIILEESPLTPESYGLSPATARLQVLTEFFNPPQPAVTTTALPTQAGINLTDENLRFGAMNMVPGRAFLLGSDAHDGGVSVSKSWVTLNGRQFLVEEVPVEALADQLAQLPAPQTASVKPSVNSVLHVVSAKRLLPVQRLTKTSPGGQFRQVAQASTPVRGLVLDYVTITSSQTNITFQADSTYYISGPFYSYGTNTFEGGTVIKFATNSSIKIPSGAAQKINWQGGAYRPVVFTAKDDNTVGESFGTGTPTGYYGNPMLSLAGSFPTPTLTGLRVSYAQTAIQSVFENANIYDAQFVNCQNGLSFGGASVFLGNALFANTVTNLIFTRYGNAGVIAQNTTFSSSAWLASAPSSSQGITVSLNNCILANLTNLLVGAYSTTNGSYNGFYHSPYGPFWDANSVITATFPFQSLAAANYYLAGGCVFTNKGTTMIDATLLTDLRKKTTYPPVICSNITISVATNFNPQVQRDTNSSPSLGYHYDPIDYALGGVYVTNANVTINPGTVIATFGTTNFAYGLGIGSGAQLVCQGLANSLNRIVQYNTVQEQAITNWSRVSSGSIVSEFLGVSPAATINCSFTDWSVPAQDAPHLNGTNGICNPISLQNCQFHGGKLLSSYPTINLTNCLFERVYAKLWSADNNMPSLRNNLFWRGEFDFAPNVTNALVKDNLFDQTTITNNSGIYTLYNGGYNAFVTNFNRLQPTSSYDVILSNSPTYQSSWLGNYYLPTNSLLLNAGSTYANLVGLYHYTVTTNQIIEGTNKVSVGYHYVALDQYGNPLDSNEDGVSDYLEDVNGNGLDDSGETPWDMIILQQPLSQVVEDGDTVTFSVDMGGNANLTFQWTFNGVPINGATNSSYTINFVQSLLQNCNYDGSYQVTISNDANSIVSEVAQLTSDLLNPLGPVLSYDLNLIPILGQRQDYTFKSGVTYYIGSGILLYGKTTIEGGAVLKFDNDISTNSSLQIMGTLTCNATPYYPAILTSIDDDAFGEFIYYSSGYPQTVTNGVPYLDLTYARSGSVGNLRICYADWGVTTPTISRRLDVWDCQFVQCDYGVVDLVAGNSTNSLHNVLFAACGAGIGASTNAITIEGEQVTAYVEDLYVTGVQPSRIALTNTIIIGQPFNLPNTCSQVIFNPDPTNFQSVGVGGYYLAANSPLHHAGNAGISSRLQNELQCKTTFPPIAIAAFTTNTGALMLSPQAPRYTNGAPDLGYYYDALDYTVGMFVLDGSQVTVLPGTAIGFRDEYVPFAQDINYWGFWLQEGSFFLSHGTPSKPIVYSDVQLVQEQPATPCCAFFIPDCEPMYSAAPAPTMDFRFCHFYAASQWYYQVWAGCEPPYNFYSPTPSSAVYLNMEDCSMKGGRITLGQAIEGIGVGGAVSWTNNSFENVAINLDPDWFDANDLTLYVDLSVQVHNNLFRGGMWFHIDPILATAGNWVFKDNMFDHVNLFQYTGEPLDYDYNGYWPWSATDLAWLQIFYPWGDAASQLLPTTTGEGGNEQVLPTAPPYQSGPFGNFYLPNTTALYGAGSTTAAALGFYHYTTRIDQMKEGDDISKVNANIGLHYVATSNSVSTTPKDTDGDGIPDYVENWHGDGLYSVHTDSETDWHSSSTDGITPDASNSVYLDIDLSGNGLVGRIKAALGMKPLDSSNPLTLTQIITGDEPNIATFEVPVNYNLMTNSGGLALNVNGIDPTIQNIQPAENGNCLVVWNTTFEPPGQEYLQVCLGLNGPIQDNAILSASGPLYPFLSTNVIQFFEAGSMFTDTSAFLDAKLFVQNADYTIDLYDVSTTTPGTWIMSITNSTDNGIIQEDWGVTNADGTPFMGTRVEADFNVLPAGTLSSAKATARAMAQKSENTPQPNHPRKLLTRATGQLSEWGPNFDFAYMYMGGGEVWYDKNSGEIWNEMQGIVDMLITPTSTDNESLYYYNSGFNYYSTQTVHPNPWGYGSTVGFPGYLKDQSRVDDYLYPDMTNSATRNFFCEAHGADLQGNPFLCDLLGHVKIWSGAVANILGNGPFNGPVGDSGVAENNPYRFVFLDACSTAAQRKWYQAFGIVPAGAGVAEAAARCNIGPQAFVGWEKPNYNPYTRDVDVGQAYTETLLAFYTQWMCGHSVLQCVGYASDPTKVIVPFPVPKNQNYIFTTIGGQHSITSTSRLIIVGHPGLTINGLDPSWDLNITDHCKY